jgi:hypothetical protein
MYMTALFLPAEAEKLMYAPMADDNGVNPDL